MGIKGIYRELGPGARVSLAKLATEHLENSGRPLRIAIDIAIWQFQTQAARGGTNPAIRTLFYRLVRLLSHAIQPIFVFDGPHKPAFKRNKRSGRGDGVATAMAKRLIRLFGFAVHDAPGEAEAECALMQQQGIVDAVLSEDVDTIMFGCTRTLRNWSSEGVRGPKTPTHVTMYDVKDLVSAGTGLDREGMVLVALMSGGDYIPEGVPGCGVKLACEAAKAGFGKSLCSLKIEDSIQFDEWKATLKHELRTNESGFFRVRHKALAIPDEFPSRQVLRHYTHPVVSNAATIDKLRTLSWSRPIDVDGLRYFVDETFDWVNKIGAVKLIRVLSQGLLVHKLIDRHMADNHTEATEEMEAEETALIKRISGKRNHHSTDGITELRVAHIPADIVGLDLSQELDETVSFDRHGLALNSDDEFEAAEDLDAEVENEKGKAKNVFDPLAPESIWLPESLLKLSVPLIVEDWEGKQRAKGGPRASGKVTRKKTSKPPAPETGALDKWVQITKSATTKPMSTATTKSSKAQLPTTDSGSGSSKGPLPPKSRLSSPPKLVSSASQLLGPARVSVTRSKQSRSNGKATAAEPTGHSNPWAYAGSQQMPRITKSGQPPEPIILSSSPLCASPPPSCAPLTSASLDIIDLCGPDEPSPPKVVRPPPRSSASCVKKPGTKGGARATSPVLPRTPPKGSRSTKQTRMDSFLATSPSRRRGSGGSPPQRSRQQQSLEAYISAAQSKASTLVEVERVAPTCSRADRALETDVFAASKTAVGGRTKKTIVPRKSACGFFRVVELSDEEGEASIIDLTGDA